MNPIQAIILDMDGTMLDSMFIWKHMPQVFLQNRGIPIPEDLGERLRTLSCEEAAVKFVEWFSLEDMTPDQVLTEWFDWATERYRTTVFPKPGVEEQLAAWRQEGVRLCIATDNDPVLTEEIFGRLGLLDLFAFVLGNSHVQRNKRFPDIYLLAAQKLGLAPAQCWVLEDSLHAAQVARAAGFTVVGVYDPLSSAAGTQEMSEACHYFAMNWQDVAVYWQECRQNASGGVM